MNTMTSTMSLTNTTTIELADVPPDVPLTIELAPVDDVEADVPYEHNDVELADVPHDVPSRRRAG